MISAPGLDLLCGRQHRAHRAHVEVQQVHTGVGVRGQQGGAGGLGPLQVPAGQAQPQLAVLGQQPLTQGQADATAEKGSERGREVSKQSCSCRTCDRHTDVLGNQRRKNKRIRSESERIVNPRRERVMKHLFIMCRTVIEKKRLRAIQT